MTVKAQGSRRWFWYYLLLLSLVACRDQTGEGPAYGFRPTPVPTEGPRLDPALVNTRWRLSELNGEPFPTHIVTTLILAPGEAGGYTGCNHWQGSEGVVVAGGEFSIPVISAETGGCAYPELTGMFKEALTLGAVAYRREGSRLLLLDEAGETVLLFTDEKSTIPQPPLPPLATEEMEDGTFFIHTLAAWDPGETIAIAGTLDPGACLRLGDAAHDYPLLIWPADMTLTEVDGWPAVTSADGDLIARPGDLLELEGVYLHPPADWRSLIPEACGGPYFAIGPGEGAITVLDTVVIVEALRNTEWALAFLAGEPVAGEIVPGLHIEAGRLRAWAQCNALTTGIYGDRPRLTISETGAFSLGFWTQTVKGCPNEQAAAQEDAFFAALDAVTSYELDGEQLRLSTPAQGDLLVFERR